MKTSFRVRAKVSHIKDSALLIGGKTPHGIGLPCPYCWQIMTARKPRQPTRDHVIPKAQDGPDVAGNILIVCAPCNHEKGNRTLAEWLGVLLFFQDERAPKVAWLLNYISERLDTEIQAGLYAEAGAAYAAAKHDQRRQRLERQAKQTGAALRAMAHDVISIRLGVPRTHWCYEGATHVRVLIGSVPEVFRIDLDLEERILAHPRAQYLDRSMRRIGYGQGCTHTFGTAQAPP